MGAIATAAHYVVFLLLLGPLPALLASLLGASLGTWLSYQGNKRWTFARGDCQARSDQAWRFCVTAAVYNLGNALLMLCLLALAPDWPLSMQLVSTFCLTLGSYWINRTWTFKNEIA
ncbi:GtrA family protein [Pseudomonas sp. MSSRFD41]|uniref:GtrA family protein n=1 Tax=unclassified Pseudomonas TaxID=196821 RepID=UPI00163ABAD2|nr:GtrA family protein [Pseudomonas sp. MSSRFD41]MBC2657533.1 GtrA family protein [Pseudomonas sp. MSSRFD41]